MRGILPNNFSMLTSPTGRIMPTVGPLCRSMQDMISMMRSIFQPNVNTKYDIYVPPCPFREDLFKKASSGKVRVGVWNSMVTSPASAPNMRAVKMAKEAIERQGFEVVEFSLTKQEILEYTEVLTTLILNFVVLPTLTQADRNYEPVIK